MYIAAALSHMSRSSNLPPALSLRLAVLWSFCWPILHTMLSNACVAGLATSCLRSNPSVYVRLQRRNPKPSFALSSGDPQMRCAELSHERANFHLFRVTAMAAVMLKNMLLVNQRLLRGPLHLVEDLCSCTAG